jgi:hypothetical protein
VDIQATIDEREDYYLITKGVVQVPNTGLASSAKGDAVYIATDNSLSPSGSPVGSVAYGRIVAVAGERGTPTGKVRIDLDLKSPAAA